MNGNLVWILAKTSAETTVAVMAESEEEAERMALHGALGDTTRWLHHELLCDDPIMTDVSEESWDELQYADQKHLLGPQPGGSTHATANH